MPFLLRPTLRRRLYWRNSSALPRVRAGIRCERNYTEHRDLLVDSDAPREANRSRDVKPFVRGSSGAPVDLFRRFRRFLLSRPLTPSATLTIGYPPTWR